MTYQTIPLEPSSIRHREELLRLWTENMSDSRIADIARERLQWLYDDNPAGAPTTLLSTYGEPPEVIGCGSILRRRTWVMGAIVEAAVPCDFAVTKAHRVGGAAIGIQRALIVASRAGKQTFLLGFPNKKSLPIFNRVGYRVLTDVRAHAKPLRSLFKIKSYISNSLLASAVSVLVDAGLRTADFARFARHAPRYRREIVDRADARFDALWEEARVQQSIAGERSSAFLNWRYSAFQSQRFRFFALTDRRNDQLIGFIVFTVRDNKVFIADLFASDLATILSPLMLAFSVAMRAQGHDLIFISYAGEPTFGKRLEGLGFRKGSFRERSLVVFIDTGANPALAAYVLDPKNWLIFDGDMDIYPCPEESAWRWS
jgi:hypothetical protein